VVDGYTPLIGLHYLQQVEYNANGTAFFFGLTGAGASYVQALVVDIPM